MTTRQRQIFCITSEPYRDHAAFAAVEVAAVAGMPGVRLKQDGESPYFPGRTVLYEWWRAEAEVSLPAWPGRSKRKRQRT